MGNKAETRSEKARRLGPATLDHLQKRQPRTQRLPVFLDDELAGEVADLASDVEQFKIRHSGQPVPDDLAAKLREAKDRLAEVTVEMVFQSIGRKRYEDLVKAHPATPEQLAEAKEEGADAPPYNVDTFPIALIAESCVQPEMSYDEVEALVDEWNQSEVMAMFSCAISVNTMRRVVQLGEG